MPPMMESKWNEHTHARTGRTTRMLEEAHRLVQGGPVFVICLSIDHSKTLSALYLETFHKPGPIFLKYTDYRVLLTSKPEVQGAPIGSTILVDHSVIESKYTRLLEELHRYDL